MLAMNRVFESMPRLVTDRGVDGGDLRTEPYGTWIRAHRDAARYYDPAGSWIVDPDSVLAVHERHRGTVAADDIAWFYVMNGHFGECEGSVPCYVEGQDRLNGWYLRSHPRGRHTDESNADIADSLNGSFDNLQAFPAVLAEFNPATGCTELRAQLDALRAAVTASTSTKKAGALAALDRYAQLCK
jgi:hypothetical protein